MTSEEFQKTFPDADSCRKYLFDIKWRDGYKCTKCGSAKGSVKPNCVYKCNKCYYAESATANTLFNNIRFGLEKAFAIVNDVVEHNEVASSYIGAKYAISKVSAWKFLKKIPKYNLDMVLFEMSKKGK